VEEFEERFSAYCGAGWGVACSSGTAALHLVLAAAGVGRGDEVIMPAFTMISTANAVAYQGAKPVLVDVEPDTFTIRPDKIEGKITKRTRAIIAVHIYGHPADIDPIKRIARKYKLLLIEDAAEAHGARYKGKPAGSLAAAACFSFYGNKIITTGEGGMVVTGNKKIYRRAAYLRDLAFSSARHFWHKELGFNYRMSNLQAAVGLAQLERVDKLVAIKRDNARRYTALLKDIAGIGLPPERPWAKNVYWMYAVTVEKEFGISKDRLRARLAQNGIDTRNFFIPINLQPIYAGICRGNFPVAEELCRKGFYLPSGFNLKKDDIAFIVNTIREARLCWWTRR
jgi:perosamine synthetase